MSAECKKCGTDIVYPVGTWPVGICPVCEREPTDDEIYNRPGVEGGIPYAMDDAPGSLGENDWRL